MGKTEEVINKENISIFEDSTQDHLFVEIENEHGGAQFAINAFEIENGTIFMQTDDGECTVKKVDNKFTLFGNGGLFLTLKFQTRDALFSTLIERTKENNISAVGVIKVD